MSFLKKTIPGIFIALVFVFVFFSNQAKADLGAFTIDSYDVVIALESDGKLLVEEKIVVDFSAQRHGIYREIPYKYKDDKGLSYNLKMNFFSVEDGEGKAWQYQESRGGGNFVLKIGHPDYFVSGRQIYNIRYSVERGVRFFEDHSEIYWNPIGVDWATTINSASVVVNLPRAVNFDAEDLICFVGPAGSQSQSCSARIVSPTLINFSSNSSLGANEGMTIAIKFPAGYVPAPSFLQKIKYFLTDNFGFLFPVIIFLLMYGIWKKRGREIDLDRASLVQYEAPDRLTPGAMGYLIKEKYSSRFVAADIVNLAVKGYLKIKEEGNHFSKIKATRAIVWLGIFASLIFGIYLLAMGSFGGFVFLLALAVFALRFAFKKSFAVPDYILIKTKDSDPKLSSHEAILFKGLFKNSKTSVKLSDLTTFYEDVKTAKESVAGEIASLGYFEKSVYSSKIFYFIISFVLFFTGSMLAGIFARIDFFIGVFISVGIISFFGAYMSKKTLKGAEAYWHVKGFREYIKTAEKHRVKFEEKENLFFEILPYAMVLGLADKWAKAFKDIVSQNPKWYESKDPNSFSPIIFASSMSSFSSQAGATTHAPSSSSSSSGFSGGSSGGGFGGGGGGSW